MNKYTLLAATAILSMGAYGVNAAPVVPDDPAASNASATFTTSVTIERPIELTATNVDFGKIMVRPNASSAITVTMDMGDVDVTSGEAYIPSGSSPSAGSACYSASTQNYLDYTIINERSYDLEGPGSAVITYTPSIRNGNIDGNPYSKCMSIGGTLSIPANAEAGSYSGSVTIDVIFTGYDQDPTL